MAGMWANLLVQPYHYLRFFSRIDLSHYAIALDRAFDALLIAIALMVVIGKKCPKIPLYFMMASLLPPLIIGVLNGNPNLTLANDSLLYLAFILKIYLFGYCLSDPFTWDIVKTFLRQYAFAALAIFGILFLFATNEVIDPLRGFQVDVDILPTALYSYASANPVLLIIVLLASLLSGKRMIFLAVLLVSLAYFFRVHINSLRRRAIFTLAVLFLGVIFWAGLIPKVFDGVAGIGRLSSTVETILEAESSHLLETLSVIDPVRFSEVRTIVDELDSNEAFAFGLGFGYRYKLKKEYLPNDFRPVGNQFEQHHSNSHFTPLGVMLKFGAFELLLWVLFLAYIFARALKRTREFAFFNPYITVGVMAYIVESFFSYVFFTTPLVPLLFSFGAVWQGSAPNQEIAEDVTSSRGD
jgi:hypothetical protein